MTAHSILLEPASACLTETAQPLHETDKTDETCSVTNQAFLEGIFGSVPSEERSYIVSFSGNPKAVPETNWAGAAYNPKRFMLSPENNNYFTYATFRPDKKGKYRRGKNQFSAIHAIVLDDIGTKVKFERLTLRPSWLLETSPGNFQAGYIFSEPLRDAAAAEKIMNVIIAEELCDPGADGPTARLARLPEAVNGKHSPAFPCRMREWHPDRRYTVEELIDGLKLDMNSTDKRKSGRQPATRPDGGDPVFIPSPTENPVITELKGRKLYKSSSVGIMHDITCPWCAEHTDAIDGGTAYFEPDENYPIGGFHCFHGHCEGRNIRDLLQNLGIETSAARGRDIIRVVAGEMLRIIDAAEIGLAKSGYYQYNGAISTISTVPGTKEANVRPLSKPALVGALSGTAFWEKYDVRSHSYTRIDPPERHCQILFDAERYNHLPFLNGLARQPYLRPDGTLATAAGYDKETGMYGAFNAANFSVPDQPTREDAENALQTLTGILAEFSFKSECDLSAALSGMLTAAIRPSLPAAPMYHVRAPQIGSGKSFLCTLTTIFATPQPGTPMAFPHDDEECHKVLIALLQHAPAVIEFDNLTSDLVSHKSLCTALTSEHLRGRILGVSKTITVTTRTLFLSSGNNVGPVQDMTRRCIPVNLDPACETPAARTFKNPDLLSDLLRERGRYVSAALTIIRAWIVAGRPKQPCKPLASYGDWSDLCRQPLLWLGQADPAASVYETMTEDPDRETLGRMLEAWYDCFGNTPKMIRDALDYTGHNFIGTGKELHEAMSDIAGERDNSINRNRLGWWLKKHAGRLVAGRRFINAGGGRSAAAWKVESVS